MINTLLRDESDLGPVSIFQFRNYENLKLQGYSWTVPNAKAIVVFLHGITTHARYEFLNHNYPTWCTNKTKIEEIKKLTFLSYENSIVELFNSYQINFFTYDQQGHGQSEAWRSSRCNVESYNDLCFDALNFVLMISYLYPTLPIFLAGASLGGAVCLRTLQLYKALLMFPADFIENKFCTSFLQSTATKLDKSQITDFINKTSNSVIKPPFFMSLKAYRQCFSEPLIGGISLCPNISIEKLKKKFRNKILLPFSKYAAAFLPTLKAARLYENEMFPWIECDRTKDKNLGSYTDPLPARISYESLHVGRYILNDSALLHDSADSISLKLLLIHSCNDTMCDISGTQKLYDNLVPNMKRVDFFQLDTMWHYLLLEPGSFELAKRICVWIDTLLSIQ